MSTIRTFHELITFPTFEQRLNYLRLKGSAGRQTFGFDRIFNQMFYTSDDWKRVRNQVIIRDNGCDLAMPGYDMDKHVFIHHMNPLTLDDIRDSTDNLMNPQYLVCVSFATHNAIHYGSDILCKSIPMAQRSPHDTCPWRM